MRDCGEQVVFGLFKKKKNQVIQQELIREFKKYSAICDLGHVMHKYNLKLSKKESQDEQTMDNTVSVTKLIVETSLEKAGYELHDLNEDKVIMVMIIAFIISDATWQYISVPAKESQYSPEYISSIVSTSMFFPFFHARVGNIYAEAMNIFNRASQEKYEWISILNVMGRSAMEFLASANEEKLTPIVSGMQLLLDNAELK